MDNYGDASTNYNANSDQPKGPIASLSRLTFQDFQNFFSKPYVIVRLFCLFCSLVVVCCISTQGWEAGFCKFNFISSTCNFGTVLGTLSILITIFFLVLDIHYENLSKVDKKKYILIADLVTQSFLSFLWFSSFCDMADKWRRTGLSTHDLGGGEHTVRAAIAFAFFAIIAFALSAFFTVRRYNKFSSQRHHTDPTAQPSSNTLSEEQFTP